VEQARPIKWTTVIICMLAAATEHVLGSLDSEGRLRSYYDAHGLPWQLILSPYLLFIGLARWNQDHRILAWVCLLTATATSLVVLDSHWQYVFHPRRGIDVIYFFCFVLQLTACIVLAFVSAIIHRRARREYTEDSHAITVLK
jgi:hypothetical protein